MTDEAALYDIQLEDDALVVRRVEEHYGVRLAVPDDFRQPFWKLLDQLERQRTNR